MILKELLSPTDLLGAEIFWIYEMTEIIVVYKEENLMLATFQIVALSFEYFNDGKKLIVVGLISSLCRNYFPRKKRY